MEMKYLKTFETFGKSVEQIIDEVRGSNYFSFLECDGCTRVLDYLLTKNNIEHKCYVGEASLGKNSMPHFWIKIGKNILDLKSKMWFGEDAKEGLFTDSPVIYKGKEVNLNTDERMYHILTI